MKLAKKESQRKSPYLLNELWNFNEIFRNDVAYDNINHKKPGIHYRFSRCILKKTTGGVKLSPNLFRIKNISMTLWLISTQDLETVYICQV